MNYKFTATSRPECEDFFLIKSGLESYQKIDTFIATHPNINVDELKSCTFQYRGREISYDKYSEEYTAFSESMELFKFQKPFLIIDNSINAAAYFTQKSIECLQFARFFTMKSALLIDTDFNLNWSQGYVPQFLFRCIYFGTATTWFSNAFDHVLQSVYLGLQLYTSAKDRNGQSYDETWDAKKIMENCTYEFVVGELKVRGNTECRNHLTQCSAKIEEVRKWANYIKHKGGIDYKYLEAEPPFKAFYVPESEAENKEENSRVLHIPDSKFEIKGFKSPIEIDIDEKIQILVDAHKAIYKSIKETILDINYEKHTVKMGANANG